jgi:peptidoglycan hydrolase-like protein with peptidoglycan-binding domain
MLFSLRLGKIPSLQSAALNRPPLKHGDTGVAVAALQELLRDLGYDFPRSFRKGNADGIFGDETTRNVEAFQRNASLKADGVVGTVTLRKLDDLIIENNIIEEHTIQEITMRGMQNRYLPLSRRTCSAR